MVVDGVVEGRMTVDGRKVRWVTDAVGLKENGSGVESDTKAGTDENFELELRVGD